MRIARVMLAALVGLALARPTLAGGPYSPEEARNKQIVLEFYDKALNQRDFAAAAPYLGAYKQHNPNVADGPEGLRQFLDTIRANAPRSHSDIKQVFVDGDFVILHVHTVREPGTRGSASINIFRLSHGKIEEHWDAVEPVPDTAKNGNSMF